MNGLQVDAATTSRKHEDERQGETEINTSRQKNQRGWRFYGVASSADALRPLAAPQRRPPSAEQRGDAGRRVLRS